MSPIPFEGNILLSPDFDNRDLSRFRLRSVTPELVVFGELEEDFEDMTFLESKALPPLLPTLIPPAPLPLPEFDPEIDFKAVNIFCPRRVVLFPLLLPEEEPDSFGDVWDDGGFFDAGPELTPGFKPVCVFGEPLPDIVVDDVDELEDVPVATFAEDEDNFRFPPDFESFVRVLLIVIFIPSELCFTIYSAGFFVSMDEFLLIHFPSAALFEEPPRFLSF